MLCNISQNAMGQPGGYPARSSKGGTLPGPARGGTLAGGYPDGGYPGQGVPWPGGYPDWGVPRPGGYPGRGGTLAGGGGTQLGQHREYLLHGGQYASCVHAGGLSCYLCISQVHFLRHYQAVTIHPIHLSILSHSLTWEYFFLNLMYFTLPVKQFVNN